jgi:type II secretory pathway component PulM
MAQNPNTMLQKLSALASKVKSALTKEYSVQDLRRLPGAMRQWWSQAAENLEKTTQDHAQNTSDASVGTINPVGSGFNAKASLQSTGKWLFQQRKALLVGLFLILLGLVYQLVLAPYGRTVSQQLEMRPAQWSQLQSLIRASKANTVAGNTFTSTAGPSTVTPLDEQEMQKILSILTARGLKPSVFRLSADNPPRIEFHASEVLFSSFIDILEELRTNWRLYPIQLSVLANGSAGMVSISAVFAQYGANAIAVNQGEGSP